ncbi:TerC family protein [Syntrophomonas erecta]
MESALLFQYGWSLLIIIALEGLLAADNALVMAVMVKHLPDEQTKKALFYGLAGAFVFRFTSLFVISYLVDLWEIQAIGAAYLLFIAVSHIYKSHIKDNKPGDAKDETKCRSKKAPGLWGTVLRVELADIAFAVDSILAAIALVVSLPVTNLPNIGGMDGAQFLVAFIGGFIGLICVRFAATYIISLLKQKPGLETTAYLIVGWVGVKLAIHSLAHPGLHVLSPTIPHSPVWKITFWLVLITIAVAGWFLSKDESKTVQNAAAIKKAV